jgi:hypothetical protein
MATDEKTEDPQRAYFLLGFLNAARDFPQTQALSAAFARELREMNLRQAQREETDERAKQEAAKASTEQLAKRRTNHEPHSSRRT